MNCTAKTVDFRFSIVNHQKKYSQEKTVLERFCKTMHGNLLLQIGVSDHTIHFCDHVQVIKTLYLDQCYRFHNGKRYIQAAIDHLPIESDSIDIVLMLHQFEGEKNSQKMTNILQEAHRTLKPNGKIIIIGNNPWSGWRFFSADKQWKKCISAGKIKRYLCQLDFQLILHDSFYFYPPKIVVEMLCQFLFPYFGGIFMVAATKKVLGMTPWLIKEFNTAQVFETQ